jgi:hypothetical protein
VAHRQRGALFGRAGKHCQRRRQPDRPGRPAFRGPAGGRKSPLWPRHGGIFLAVFTGHLILDSLLAAATGVDVLWPLVPWSPGSRNSSATARPAHDLRTRHAGRLTFLEFHLVVPGSMTVAAAHQICDRIEDALKAEMDHLMITIHVELEEKAKHGGVPVL